MRILITGGAGYIGSHLVKLLDEQKEELLIIDNLCRGHRAAVPLHIPFEQIDISDEMALQRILDRFRPEAIIHFAAFAYVGESVENPEIYYQNNVAGSLQLLRKAVQAGVKYFVFSSTCSLYGNPQQTPISEQESIKPINPYAKSKLAVEYMLSDFSDAYGMKYAALRYFNAAGADFDGEIGESHEPESHLIPLVLYTAMGKRDAITVFGDDYDTPDGTGVRDYIHVIDLADAHIKALQYLAKGGKSDVFNLGTGDGNSVREIIEKAKAITGKDIPVIAGKRRAGDPAVLVADSKKAAELLNWKPRYNISDIISSAWKWHNNQRY